MHIISYKLYQCNPYDSLSILIYNMCSLDISFILYNCVECCSIRMRKCLIHICVVILFWTAFQGDAPKPSHAQLCRVIWVCVRMRWVRGFPLVDPAPHHGTWAFQGPSSGRTSCTKGRVPLGTHTHPLRQSWWQEPQHLGCSPCWSCVGLSYELYIIRSVFSYCIHIVPLSWFNYII